MAKKDKITIQGTEIMFFSQKKEDYISLTDMAKYKNAEIPAHVISHWLSTKYTIEFMGILENQIVFRRSYRTHKSLLRYTR